MSFGGNRTTTQTTRPDAGSQAYINAMRQGAAQGADVAMNGTYFTGPQTMSVADQAAQFMNPYMSQVVDATRGEFDHLRNQAGMQSNQQATQQGAFGGSRAAVQAGSRLGEIDRAQGSQIANLLNSGYQNALSQGTQYAEYQRQLQEQKMQEPLWKQQQAQAMMQGGLGPVGQVSTQQQPGGSWLGGALGGAQAGAAFGPWGAGIGGVLGGLGGLFG